MAILSMWLNQTGCDPQKGIVPLSPGTVKGSWLAPKLLLSSAAVVVGERDEAANQVEELRSL